MSAQIRINNWDAPNLIETSELTADAAIGATSLTLKSAQGFNADNFVILGRLSGETAELRSIGSINSDLRQITVTYALKFAHAQFESIVSLFGNQIKVYRATNVDGTIPADNQFSLLTTINIDPDQSYTDYKDASGGSSYWYKATFFNETTTAETDIGNSVATRGGGYGNYCTIDSIRGEAGIRNNRFITDATVNEKRLIAQQLIDSQLNGIYTIPFTAPVNALISAITRTYAAGLLLVDNYGPAVTLNTNEGNQKLLWVTNEKETGQLDKLRLKKLTLTDPVTGSDISNPGTSGSFGGFPDADGDGTGSASERAFRMSDVY